jgi:hypothetical protein
MPDDDRRSVDDDDDDGNADTRRAAIDGDRDRLPSFFDSVK